MSQQKISRYHILEIIGRGGMATVYRAFDPMFKRDVAVKVMAGEHLTDKMLRARFEREAQTIAALEHPAIVPVYDFGEQDGRLYLVMRIMTGGTLTDRLQGGSLPVAETSHILQRIGGALERAHDKGIIHRDLKPSNILFDSYGDAFLADFGIARLTESTVTLTGQAVVGTPAYMSPEQIHGDKQIDGRSDIYALGVICFEMLTGQRPYQDATPTKVMMKHIIDPVPNIREVKPDLPEGVDVVIAKTMAKAPDERYSTAGEMTDTLDSIARPNFPAAVPVTPPPPAPAQPESDEPTVLVDEPAASAVQPLAEPTPQDHDSPVEATIVDEESLLGSPPETEIARPVFPTKPKEKQKRSPMIPIIGAGCSVLALAAIVVIILAVAGVFTSDADDSTPETAAIPATSVPASGEDGSTGSTASQEDSQPTPIPQTDHVDQADSYMEEAWALFEAGEDDAALERVQMAVDMDPDYAYNYFQRAEMYMMMGDFSAALADTNRAIDREELADYYHQRGVIFRELGDSSRAIADYQAAIELEPDRSEFYNDLGIDHRYAGDLGASLEAFDIAIDMQPFNSYFLAQRSYTLRDIGDSHAALDDALLAYDIDPNEKEMLDHIAGIYAWDLEDPANALNYMDMAIEVDPDQGGRYTERSMVHRALGNGDNAMADHNKAIELEPDASEHYIERGVTFKELFGAYDKALADFDMAMGIDPGDPGVYDNRAGVFADSYGDFEAAMEEINLAIELDPNEAWRYQWRAWLFQNMGELDAALADFIQATELDTAEAWSFIDLGYFYFDVLGDVDLAFDAWNIAVEMEPENPDAYHARYLYFAHVLEDYDAAIADLNRCIMRNPEHPWCHWERAWLLENIGDVEAAIRDFEAFLDLADDDDCPECMQEAFEYINDN